MHTILLCFYHCGCIKSSGEFVWSIQPYFSGLLRWRQGNIPFASEVILRSMGQIWPQQNMTLHERHVVSAYVDSLWGPTSKKRQSPHYWPFVMGITGEFPAQRACNAKKTFHLMT